SDDLVHAARHSFGTGDGGREDVQFAARVFAEAHNEFIEPVDLADVEVGHPAVVVTDRGGHDERAGRVSEALTPVAEYVMALQVGDFFSAVHEAGDYGDADEVVGVDAFAGVFENRVDEFFTHRAFGGRLEIGDFTRLFRIEGVEAFLQVPSEVAGAVGDVDFFEQVLTDVRDPQFI